MYRQEGEDCDVVKQYSFNECFDGTPSNIRRLRNGINLGWKSRGVKGSQYKTFHDFSFYHTGLIYSNSTSNLERALTRLTSRRFEEGMPPEYDVELRDNQLNCYPSLSRCFRRYHDFYFVSLRDRIFSNTRLIGSHQDEVKKNAYEVHAKREPRIRAYNYILESGGFGEGVFVKEVKGKVKYIEFAKPGKYPRLVNDLTCEGSLYGGFLAKIVKHAFEGELNFNSRGKTVRSEFIAHPEIDSITRVFTRLINPEKTVEFYYHSDDSCISIQCEDGIYFGNVDISSCDASNGEYIFKICEYICSLDPSLRLVMAGCIEQCRKKLKLRNPGSNREKFVIKPKIPVEYSGSVLTTLLNNIANSLIVQAVFARVCRSRNLRVSEMPNLIRLAASDVGYIVTCVSPKTYHGLQFLKHSPVMSSLGLTANLNAGVILRMLGQCDGDLPGRGDIVTRARAFNSALIQGVVHSGQTTLLKTLQEKLPPQVAPKKFVMPQLPVRSMGLAKGDIPDSELCARYSMQPYELEELYHYIRNASFGDKIFCSAVSKILRLDYGLGYLV